MRILAVIPARAGSKGIPSQMGVNFYDTAKALNITPMEAARLYIDKAAEAGIDCARSSCFIVCYPTQRFRMTPIWK